MKDLGYPHLWIRWLITCDVILLYLLVAYAVSIGFRKFCLVEEMLNALERAVARTIAKFYLVFVRS